VGFAPAEQEKQNNQMKSTNKDDNQMKRTPPQADDDFAALIGLDWGSQVHALCLYDCATGRQESSTLEPSPR
jgi:hypothetical protein